MTEPTVVNKKNIEDRPQFLNTVEAAEFLGVKRGWLDKRRASREGPSFTKLGGIVRYKKADLLKLLEESEHSVGPE